MMVVWTSCAGLHIGLTSGWLRVMLWAHFTWTDVKHCSCYHVCSISILKIRLFSSQFCQCPAWSWRSTPWISLRPWQRGPMRLRFSCCLRLRRSWQVHADNSFYSKLVAKSMTAMTQAQAFFATGLWPCFDGRGLDLVSSVFFDTYAEAENNCIGVQLIFANLPSLMRDLKPHLQEALQTRLGNEPCYFASQEGVMKFSSGFCVLIWHARCYTKKMISAGDM